MKRILVTALLSFVAGGAALAADLPPAAPPPPRAPAVYVPAPAAFTWTGFYIGGNLGGGRNHGTITDTSLF